MRYCRSVVLLAINIALLTQPGVAWAQRDNPSWKSQSNLPVETITGEWSVAEDGRAADLTITGSNLAAQTTKFVGSWRTPWVDPDTFLEEKGTLETFLSPATSADLFVMTRFRSKRESWSRWFKHRLPYEEGLAMGGVGAWAGGGALLTIGPQPPRIQYEWRIVGEIDGLATIDASAHVALN